MCISNIGSSHILNIRSVTLVGFPKRFILASKFSLAFYVVKFHGRSNIVLCGCTKMTGAIICFSVLERFTVPCFKNDV